MSDDKPGFTVTTNDAAETVIIGDTSKSQFTITAAKPDKPGKGDTNVDAP